LAILLLLCCEKLENNSQRNLKVKKSLISIFSIIGFISLLLSSVPFVILLPLTLRNDQSTLITCTKFQVSCYTFVGFFDAVVLSSYWGPSLGWMTAILSSAFALISTIFSCFQKNEKKYMKLNF